MQQRFLFCCLTFSLIIALGGYCASTNRLPVYHGESQQLAEASSIGTEKISGYSIATKAISVPLQTFERWPSDISPYVVIDRQQSTSSSTFSDVEDRSNLIPRDNEKGTTEDDNTPPEDSDVVVQYDRSSEQEAEIPRHIFTTGQISTPTRRLKAGNLAAANTAAATETPKFVLSKRGDIEPAILPTPFDKASPTRYSRRLRTKYITETKVIVINVTVPAVTSSSKCSLVSMLPLPTIISTETAMTTKGKSCKAKTSTSSNRPRITITVITDPETIEGPVFIPTITGAPSATATTSSNRPRITITVITDTKTTEGPIFIPIITETPSSTATTSSNRPRITITVITDTKTTEGPIFIPIITETPSSTATSKAKTSGAKDSTDGLSVILSASEAPVTTIKTRPQSPVRSSSTKEAISEPSQSNEITTIPPGKTSSKGLYVTPTTKIMVSSMQGLTSQQGGSCKAKTSRHLDDNSGINTTAMETGILVSDITTLTSTTVQTVTRPGVTSKTVTITITPSVSTRSYKKSTLAISETATRTVDSPTKVIITTTPSSYPNVSEQSTSTKTQTVTRTKASSTTVTTTIAPSLYSSRSMQLASSDNGASTPPDNGLIGITQSVVHTSNMTKIKTGTETSQQTITTTDIQAVTTTEQPMENDIVSTSSVPEPTTKVAESMSSAATDITSSKNAYYLILSPTTISQQGSSSRQNTSTTTPLPIVTPIMGLTSVDRPTEIITIRGANTTVTTTEIRTKLTFTTKMLQMGDVVETLDNLSDRATVKPNPQSTGIPDGKSLGRKEKVSRGLFMTVMGLLWGWRLLF